MASHLRHRIARQASHYLHRRTVRVPDGFPPTVSFSFDDVPRSALENGLPILREAGILATWYIATGLLGRPSEVGPVMDAADVLALHEAGHEIGCHTHSHLRAEDVRERDYDDDLAANAAALARTVPGLVPHSFSFPFGSVTPATKRDAAARHATCRGTESGVVRGTADLALLPANRLYSASVPLSQVDAMVADVRARGGWLIFYTHDVAAAPSGWGCTPGYFAEVVAAVGRAGLAVRPVGAAAALLGAR